MTAPTRRQLIAGGTATAAGVALLAGGGRALAAPEVAAQPHPAVPPTADPTGLSPFGFMFPGLDPLRVDPDPGVALARLQALAASMLDPNVTTPTAGNRDNVGSGSIFTYFGQFLDHDITLDLEPQPTRFFAQSRHGLLLDDDDGKPVRNNESFRFDLSSLYGGGPHRSPQLYEADGVHFRIQEPNANGVRDLPRNADGSAILVEHRNDENEIITQVHVMFLKFHNAVVDRLGLGFERARATVIRYYQWVILHEFLPEIVGQDVVDGLLDGSIRSFYKPGNPHHPMTPVEFSTAGYRFGHSMVRKAYVLNGAKNAAGALLFKLQVFNASDADLHGGRPIPSGRQIDWGHFIPGLRRADIPDAEFNFPRFVDTLLSSGLFNLPIGGLGGTEDAGANILGFRNLVRGLFYGLPSGQDVARAMGVRPIAPDDLLAGTVQSKTVAGFGSGTPLWFYILGESEAQGGLRLGTVGGRIVADVFLGMLRADQHGLLHSRHLGRFRPAPPIAPEAGRFGLADLAVFAGVAERP